MVEHVKQYGYAKFVKKLQELDFNSREAYRQAFPNRTANMSDNSLSVRANQMLNTIRKSTPELLEEIGFGLQERIKSIGEIAKDAYKVVTLNGHVTDTYPDFSSRLNAHGLIAKIAGDIEKTPTTPTISVNIQDNSLTVNNTLERLTRLRELRKVNAPLYKEGDAQLPDASSP